MKTNLLSGITVATYFTFLRLLCVPCLMVSMMSQAWLLTTFFFVLASVTDVIDGMLARLFNEVTWFGSILDPIVDKILLITVYAGLVYNNFIPIQLPSWFLLMVIVHEVILVLGAFYWVLIKQKMVMSPSRLAKLVGVGQFLFIFWALLCGFVHTAPSALFYLVLMLIVIARMCVLIQYGLRTYRRVI